MAPAVKITAATQLPMEVQSNVLLS